MKHFSRDEFSAYKKGLTGAAESLILEDHLLECDDCLAVFLEMVDEVEIAEAAMFVPADFSTGLAAAVKHFPATTSVTAPSISHRRKRANLLTAYASAAAVTLFLASNGVFSSLSSAAAGNVQNQDLFESPFSILAEREKMLIDEYSTSLDLTNQRYLNLLNIKSESLKEVNP